MAPSAFRPATHEAAVHSPNMTRRTFLMLAGVLGLYPDHLIAGVRPADPQMTLFNVPLELGGNWGSSPPGAVMRVLTRMRKECLSGVKLVSDRQPNKIRIDNHPDGPPAIWLHTDPPNTAWIIVDIGPDDWCKLSYQFGHELGHVLCNSWDSQAKPRPPTQWLEEAMVEAFSIRGLALLAASWEKNPPFAGNAGFAASIRDYRRNLTENYEKEEPSGSDITSWFGTYRKSLESGGPVPKGRAALAILPFLERDKAYVGDLGAVNRWPARSGLPIEEYLAHWEKSCQEVRSSGRLPSELKNLFRLN